MLIIRPSVIFVFTGLMAMAVKAQELDAEPGETRIKAFSYHLPEGVGRYLQVRKPDAGYEIDPARLQKAIQNSIAWIRAVLKSDFVPSDLEQRIEGIPAGLGETDRRVGLDKWPRFDCTTVEFDSGGHHFLVVQDSMSLVFIVASTRYERQAKERSPASLAQAIEDWVTEVFQHAQVGLYLHPVRVTDFGVDTPLPSTVWNDFDKLWGPTVVKPPKAWEDGLLHPIRGLRPYDERVAAKLHEIDPTIPDEQVTRDHYWRNTYAATDARVLVYMVPKISVFQIAGSVAVPDWFRVLKPGELPEDGSHKGGQTRLHNAIDPPK